MEVPSLVGNKDRAGSVLAKAQFTARADEPTDIIVSSTLWPRIRSQPQPLNLCPTELSLPSLHCTTKARAPSWHQHVQLHRRRPDVRAPPPQCHKLEHAQASSCLRELHPSRQSSQLQRHRLHDTAQLTNKMTASPRPFCSTYLRPTKPCTHPTQRCLRPG